MVQSIIENVVLHNDYKHDYKGNYFHVLRKGSKELKMQENFIFFDTESNEQKIDKKTKKLTFRLGTAIFWNRIENKINNLIFYDISKFWNRVDLSFDKNHQHYIMYAHNSHFDMKMVDGFNQLDKRGWKLLNHYVRSKTYILIFKKGNYYLHVWDTSNYFSQGFSVAQLGEVLGYPKLEINFKRCTNQELEIYCMRDTEIIFKFIENMINFLIENDLTRLKATASSLSFNAFRRKFYDDNGNKIWIHNWKQAIKLERASYRGGITDVFKLGKCENVYKLDVNSEYPKIMREMKLPTCLFAYTHCSDKQLNSNLPINEIFKNYKIYKNDWWEHAFIDNLTDFDYEQISSKLMEAYNEYKKDYGIIARVKVWMPKKYAYLLYDYGLGKTSFAWGKFEIVLCTPELEFVEKYGKILEIQEISIYEVKYIFKEFVDFFYTLKLKYHKEGNKVFRDFCKLFLNGQYGKWGQKEYVSERLDEMHEYLKRHQDLIFDMIMDKIDLIESSAFVYLGAIDSKELYIIDKQIYLSYKTDDNSREAFVAISSFITSGARMLLIDYVLLANYQYCNYADTDSLFVDQKGYQNLLENDCIDDFELGKMKFEGRGDAHFYNPKFYDFFDYDENEWKRKCKGIKQKNCELVKENEFMVKYKIEHWDKFKTDMKHGNFDNQYVRIAEKVMSKKYDKGFVRKNGKIEPFHVNQIKNN